MISQAAGRDLYSGGKLMRYYGRLTMIAGLAAVVGPVVGGQLAGFTDWRGFFVLLAAVGVLILLACLFVFRETLPETSRTTGGRAQTGRLWHLHTHLGQFRIFAEDFPPKDDRRHSECVVLVYTLTRGVLCQ